MITDFLQDVLNHTFYPLSVDTVKIELGFYSSKSIFTETEDKSVVVLSSIKDLPLKVKGVFGLQNPYHLQVFLDKVNNLIINGLGYFDWIVAIKRLK